MSSSRIVVLVNHRALPGREEQARQELARLIATVLREEPDCAGIEMLQDANDPARFALLEQWPSQKVFEGPHMQTEHIRAFIDRANAFLAGPPEITFWRPVE